LPTNFPEPAVLSPKLLTAFLVGDTTASKGPNLGHEDHTYTNPDGADINAISPPRP
jgi:hypothetical protein